MERFDRFSIVIDKELNALRVEDEFLTCIGVERLANLEEIVFPNDLTQIKEVLDGLEKKEQRLTCFRIRSISGKFNWVAANLEFAEEEGDAPAFLMGLNDIRSLEENISESKYDQMTGLLNKRAIINRANYLAARRPYQQFYLCVMDIDNFKSVNDVYGHMRGDEVIIDVAHMIRDCVGEAGSVGRIGGDEYMVLLEKAYDEPTARIYLQAIRDGVRALYASNGDGLHVTVTMGAVLFPDYAHNYEELFMVADKMLYIGKLKGRDRYIIYTPELHGDVLANNTVSDVGYRRRTHDKTKLILGLLDHLLHGEKVTVQKVMREVVCYYNLDEMYVFLEGGDTSVYGMEHRDGDDASVKSCELEMQALHAENIDRFFNQNGVAILDFHEMKREYCVGIYDYIEEKEIRYMIIYRMVKTKRPGHIVFVNKRENARKFADSDVSDLTYISKMLEVIAERE